MVVSIGVLRKLEESQISEESRIARSGRRRGEPEGEKKIFIRTESEQDQGMAGEKDAFLPRSEVSGRAGFKEAVSLLLLGLPQIWPLLPPFGFWGLPSAWSLRIWLPRVKQGSEKDLAW